MLDTDVDAPSIVASSSVPTPWRARSCATSVPNTSSPTTPAKRTSPPSRAMAQAAFDAMPPPESVRLDAGTFVGRAGNAGTV